MRPLTAIELLNVWEAGIHQPLLEKSLHLLQIACSSADINSMAALSIGERDVRLLRLREWLFGTRLKNKANCPVCAEPVEWENPTADLYLQASSATDLVKEFTLEKDSFTIRFRLLNSYDINRAIKLPTYRSNPQRLVYDCIIGIMHEKQEYPIEALPDNLIETLSEQMRQEDPQADIQMLVNCPTCGQQWGSNFDIVSYLWLEIDSWAKHILEDVYTISKELGWSENDILRMSSQRRQFYLAMIRA